MTPEEEEQLDLAWEALEDGAFEDALRLVRAVLAKNPHEGEAGELEARALAATGAEELALQKLVAAQKKEPDAVWPFLVRAELMLRGDDPQPEEALKVLKDAARRARGESAFEAEVAFLEGLALLGLEEEVRALERFDAALQRVPEHLDARVERATLRFELARFALAKEDLALLVAPPLEIADAWHILGLIAEREGDHSAAKKAFATATRLDPEAFPAPTALSEAEFDEAVKDALSRLPDDARAALEDNVLVTVAQIPSDEDLDGGALSPSMLGIFKGTPHGARSLHSQADHATAQIILFQKNLERATRSREELIEEIGITVAHEVGHLLGLDEDDLKDRGLD
jgi:predicted Zn-dependent protease with MMP-like domain